jgi:hypothetical protein
MLRRGYFVGITLLLALVSFVVTATAGAVVVVLWAAVVGGLAVVAVKVISQAGEPASEIAPMLTAGAIVAGSGGLKWIAGPAPVGWPDAAAVLVGLATAWGLDVLVGGRSARECFICKLPIDERVPFACPRCHQVICTRPSCWIARRFRCRYCDERDVIIFPIDEKWWLPRFGPRVRDGSCTNCMKEAHEADLRACGRCRRPMCKRCWDYHNGQCAHCGWVVPDPPAALRPFLTAGQPSERQRHHEPDAQGRR